MSGEHKCRICGKPASRPFTSTEWCCAAHDAAWKGSIARQTWYDTPGARWDDAWRAWRDEQIAKRAKRAKQQCCARCHLSPCMCGIKAGHVFEISRVAHGLGLNAQRVLLEVAKRLDKGAREHGDFDPAQRRNWAREEADEHLDAIVYATLDALERSK